MRLPAFLLVLPLLAGCQTVGYRDLPQERLGYVQAVAESWKEEMLLNIVRVRYLDPPVFFDVASVISTTSLETEISLSGTLFPHASIGNSRSLGAAGRYGLKPTVTYQPLTGERLVKSMLTPIAPETIFAIITGGGRADFILRTSVQAINGIYNTTSSPSRDAVVDPRFAEVCDLLRSISERGSMSLRIEPRESGLYSSITFRPADDEAASAVARLKALLKLDPQRETFFLGFSAMRNGPDEIVLLTRTMQGIIGDLAAGVEVPEEDVATGRATKRKADAEILLRIKSGSEQPRDAYAATFYRNRWFWIDDTDLESKRMFRFLAMFGALAETGTTPAVPLLTIPAR
ncbi:MAG: hypothetical protein ACK4N6_03085 [Rhodocyclaceae bacterium]